MKNFNKYLIVNLLFITASSLSYAAVFKGTSRGLGNFETTRIATIELAHKIAVSNCVEANFSVDQCEAAKHVETIMNDHESGQSGVIITSILQIGVPVCN